MSIRISLSKSKICREETQSWRVLMQIFFIPASTLTMRITLLMVIMVHSKIIRVHFTYFMVHRRGDFPLLTYKV